MYFDKMRFLVFDLLPATHKNYRFDKVRFLSALLIFATNTVPSSTMESRKLYVLECEEDDTPLFTIVTSYDKKLAQTYEVIENEIDRICSEVPGELTDKAAESLFCSPVNIDVKLDENCDFDALYAEGDFAFMPKSPEGETDEWGRDVKSTQKAYGSIIRQQRRSVKKGIERLNVNSELTGSNISRLTQFQLDDIRDYTENAEDEMIVCMPPSITRASEHEAVIEEKANAVKDILERRMSRLTTILASVIILALTALLYVPFIMANFGNSDAISSALEMLGLSVAILAIALVITLFVLKLPLNSALKDYNETMREIATELNENMKKFSRYFSITCNVRRGFKVQRYAQKNLDESTKSVRIRRKHQEDIKKKRAELSEAYSEFIADSKYFDNTMIQPYDFDFEKRVEYTYAAPFMAGFCRNIDFLEPGNQVLVPSGYITHITVRMEEMYDK